MPHIEYFAINLNYFSACSTDDDCSNGGSCYAYIGAAYAMCYSK